MNWTDDEEGAFWRELADAWHQAGGRLALSTDCEAYLGAVCGKAFHRTIGKLSFRDQLPKLSGNEVWMEVWAWFENKYGQKKGLHFVDDLIQGGIHWGRKNRPHKLSQGKEDIETYYKEIKGRLCQRIATEFIRDWITDLGINKNRRDLEKEEPVFHPLTNDDEYVGQEGAEAANHFFFNVLTHDCSRWAGKEIVKGRAEKLVFLFGCSKLLNRAFEDLVENMGVHRKQKLYEEFGKMLGELKLLLLRYNEGVFKDRDDFHDFSKKVLNNLLSQREEWFFSEKLNVSLFSWFERYR